MKYRIEENIAKILMVLSSVIILAVLCCIIITVAVKGAPSMNWDMITKTPQGGFYLGKEGGILNAIMGSLYITLISAVFAFIIAFPVVIYFRVYAKRGSVFVSMTRFAFDVLWGIPSIVYGAFVFTLMLFLGMRACMLSGIIAITLFMVPIMARAMDESMKMIPDELIEASYSLGATKWETAIYTVMRQGMPGIITGLLIAIGRGIGDAAAVLFTAGFSDNIPVSLLRPAATLPLAIFFQLNTPFPEVQERAYAAALILTAVILIISICSRILGNALNKFIIK